MSYYVELNDGNRMLADEWTYNLLTRLYGYMHLVREERVTIIKAGV